MANPSVFARTAGAAADVAVEAGRAEAEAARQAAEESIGVQAKTRKVCVQLSGRAETGDATRR